MSLSRTLFVVLAASIFVPQIPVHAQRGELIEGLFRTIAEAQLEREQRKRLEAERAATQPQPIDRNRSELNIPPTAFPPSGRPGAPRQGASINVRSREAAEFAQNLVNFNGGIDTLVNELKSGATRNPAIRGLLPNAYQVSADTRALIQQCDGLSALQPVVAPYSELDARWRQLSFSLRSLDGLSDQCTASIRNCDKQVGLISRQLNIEPQFDRHALHDLMVIAATYQQTLMDDLQLAKVSPQQAEKLIHDCRLLRQRLLGEADRIEETTYSELVTRFTDFVTRWGEFSQQIYAINDPYLQRRLNRISEIGDQTYALLWMPPPYNARSLTATAQRLEQNYIKLYDQLTFRTLATLSRADQNKVYETSRRLHDQCHAFEEATTKGASRRDLQRLFTEVDRDWASLRSIFSQMRTINQATLASIDHECDQIRGALGLTAAFAPSINLGALIQVAAALEGSSEYLDADLHRYERYFQPESYRKSVMDASHELLLHSKQLHAHLDSGSNLSVLQREAGLMFDGWQQLSKELGHVESHGLSPRRAESLLRSHQEMAPLVAQIAAALLER